MDTRIAFQCAIYLAENHHINQFSAINNRLHKYKHTKEIVDYYPTNQNAM